jgi:hypothetical protein
MSTRDAVGSLLRLSIYYHIRIPYSAVFTVAVLGLCQDLTSGLTTEYVRSIIYRVVLGSTTRTVVTE